LLLITATRFNAVGLLLTKAEFDEVVPKLFQNHQFDVSFLDNVYNITRGYVGACEDFLRVACAHAVIRSSWTNDMKALEVSSVFGRGLPLTT
jgi:hypothetical protein